MLREEQRPPVHNPLRFQRANGDLVTIEGSDMNLNEAIARDRRENPQRWGITAQHVSQDEEQDMPLNLTHDDLFGSDDEDDRIDTTPPPTFNLAQWEAQHNSKRPSAPRRAPADDEDDEDGYSPPPTFNAAAYNAVQEAKKNRRR